jgi:hypothetical protein
LVGPSDTRRTHEQEAAGRPPGESNHFPYLIPRAPRNLFLVDFLYGFDTCLWTAHSG